MLSTLEKINLCNFIRQDCLYELGDNENLIWLKTLIPRFKNPLTYKKSFLKFLINNKDYSDKVIEYVNEVDYSTIDLELFKIFVNYKIKSEEEIDGFLNVLDIVNDDNGYYFDIRYFFDVCHKYSIPINILYDLSKNLNSYKLDYKILEPIIKNKLQDVDIIDIRNICNFINERYCDDDKFSIFTNRENFRAFKYKTLPMIKEINFETLDLFEQYSDYFSLNYLVMKIIRENDLFQQYPNKLIELFEVFKDSFIKDLGDKELNKEDLIDEFSDTLNAFNALDLDNDPTLKAFNLLIQKIKYGAKIKENIDIIQALFNINTKDGSLYNYINTAILLYNFKKKNFIKFFFENSSFRAEIHRYATKHVFDVLYELDKIIEVGQLSLIEAEEIFKTHNFSAKLKKVKEFMGINNNSNKKISFKEFMLLSNMKNYSYSPLHKYFNLKVNKRILLLQDILNIEKSINDTEMTTATINFIDGKPFNNFCEGFKISKELSVKDKIYLIYIKSKNIDTDIDLNILKYAIKNGIDISKIKDDKDIIEHIVNNDEVKVFLNERLIVSENFKKKHFSNIIKFILSTEYKIFNYYYSNYYVKKHHSIRRNLCLITKAIIAGKYDDIKYVYEDIIKETEYTLTAEQFESWKNNSKVCVNEYVIRDSGSFKDIMRIGDIPTKTCMNYIDGSYSECLLSNFDTTKKILLISKNNKIVARAILRITKSSLDNLDKGTLKFKDFDEEIVDTNSEMENSKTDKILFVEKLYTSLDSRDINTIMSHIIDFLKEKALSIGVKLVISKSYVDICCFENLRANSSNIARKFIFISASKNGKQYHDSLNGSTSSSKCYIRGSVIEYN